MSNIPYSQDIEDLCNEIETFIFDGEIPYDQKMNFLQRTLELIHSAAETAADISN